MPGSRPPPPISGRMSPASTVRTAPRQPDRLYVVEQAGTIRYVEGRRIAGTLLDIRSRVGSGGERGLLSVAFSPRYPQNHLLYVNYTDKNGDSRVVEFRTRIGQLSSFGEGADGALYAVSVVNGPFPGGRLERFQQTSKRSASRASPTGPAASGATRPADMPLRRAANQRAAPRRGSADAIRARTCD
jgi:Glucose / Sorbosone dehydrogenase